MSSLMQTIRDGDLQDEESFVVVYSDRMSEEEGSPSPPPPFVPAQSSSLEDSASTVVEANQDVDKDQNVATTANEERRSETGGQQPLMVNSDQDFLSITSYSGSSAGSNDYETQLEETRVKMNEIILQNQTLKKSLDNANSELLEHISKTQEMKRNTLAEAQKFSEMYEKSRNEIEKLRDEKKQLADSLTECEEMLNKALEQNMVQQVTDTVNAAKSEDIELLEAEIHKSVNQVAQRDALIRGLQETIASEIEQNKALKELIRRNEEYMKRNNEVLSKSDEVVAKSLSEKEELESKISQLQNQVEKLKEDNSTLESTMAESHLRSDASKKAFEVLKTNYDKVIASNESLRAEKEKLMNGLRDQTVRIAAMQAEHEQQIDQFRMNFSEKDAEITNLTKEKVAVQEELSRVLAVLEQKTEEFNNFRAQVNGSEQTSTSQSAENTHRSVFRVVHPDVDIREGPVAGSFEFVEVGQQSPQSRTAPAATPDPNTFGPCPLCNKRFPTQKKLTIHASTCGEDYIEEQGRRSDPFVFP